ncbi:sugar ABC transporter ATP-binding protein [Thermosipho atlanticus]|uniref:sugar ABC transporter ATP-binding protein n=1 Tax=Thermosipho atlanticus TaxID=238991 RepID=UPI0009325DB4|nr:sugar ABC transporter ATP-binding protein [Thermosipho atlanticus]
MQNIYAIELKGISKYFPGVQALKNVDFRLERGEIKALIGENGAGKSTLIKILTGAYFADEGEIYIFGKRIERMTPIISEKLGISAVYQNLVLAPHLTVAENIFLNDLPSKLSFVSENVLNQMAKEVLKKLEYDHIIDPREKVKNLSVAHQGIVAIGRAISKNAKIVIFDEPTAVLTSKETDELFRIIRELKKEGVSVIYISHRLEEIFEICDKAYVLKDGQFVIEKDIKETNEDELISYMVGRKLRKDFYVLRKKGKEILKVENLENRKLKNCSFNLLEGEIVGLYGLVGSGRTELVRAIFGADKIDRGNIYINGSLKYITNTLKGINNKLALIPEDRRNQGLALKLSVKENINLPIYRKISRFGFVNSKKEKQIAQDFVEKLNIKTPDIYKTVKNLSGGNQQKVVIAKWLASNAKVFIMDEPTNGIDVGAKEEIYSIMNELAKNGASILFISSYMPELMGICDRILVMNSGKIVANIPREEFNEEKILAYAIKSSIVEEVDSK